jgi:hypothetical protein
VLVNTQRLFNGQPSAYLPDCDGERIDVGDFGVCHANIFEALWSHVSRGSSGSATEEDSLTLLTGMCHGRRRLTWYRVPLPSYRNSARARTPKAEHCDVRQREYSPRKENTVNIMQSDREQ